MKQGKLAMKIIKKYWIGICSSIAIGFFWVILYLTCSVYNSHSHLEVSETVGRSLVFALIGFFCANSIRKRWGRKRLEFWIFCFSISFSVCAIYDFGKAQRQIVYYTNFKKEIVCLMQDFVDQKMPQKSINAYSRKEYGDFSVFLLATRQSAEISNKIMSEMNGAVAKLEEVFDFTNLSNPEYFLQSQGIINNCVHTLNECERWYNQESARIESLIGEAVFENRSLKYDFVKGHKEGKIKANEFMTEYFNIERDCFGAIDKLVNFLSERQGQFFMSEDDTLTFKEDVDIDGWNVLAQNLAEHIEKEESIVKRMEDRREFAMQNWKSSTGSLTS